MKPKTTLYFLWSGLILSSMIFSSGCVAKHYSGDTVPEKEIVVIHLYHNGAIVETIDGKPARPSAARGLIPIIGGGYFTMARSLSTDQAHIKPGDHTLGIGYNDGSWVSSPVAVTVTLKAGHAYQPNAILGKSTSPPGTLEKYQTRKWMPFIEDLTVDKKMDYSPSELLETLEPAKPLSESTN